MPNIDEKRKLLLIACHSLIFLLGLVAIILQIFKPIDVDNGVNSNGFSAFRYFTNDGNIYCLVISFVIIFLLLFYPSNKNNKIIYFLSLSQAVIGAVIFFVVVLVLTPIMGNFLLKGYSMIILHVINPLLFNFVLFFVTKKETKQKFYYNFIVPAPIYLYGIIALSLCLSKTWTGSEIPYPFLDVYNNPVIVSILSTVGILGGSFLLTFVFDFIYNRCHKIKK